MTGLLKIVVIEAENNFEFSYNKNMNEYYSQKFLTFLVDDRH